MRIYGKTAVLWGLVDVTPGKGETYRTRTLEVYTQNAARRVADVSERVRQGASEISRILSFDAESRRSQSSFRERILGLRHCVDATSTSF